MVRLGYNANGWRRYPLATALRELALIGYDSVELWCHPVHLDVQRATAQDLAVLHAALDEHGLRLSNLHTAVRDVLGDGYEPTLMAADAAQRGRRCAFVCSAIDAAAALGTELVALNTGYAQTGLPAADTRANLLDSLHRCLDHAGERGVRLLVEPEPGMAVESVRDYIGLVSALGEHPALGLNLDVGHAQWGYEDVPAIIRELESHVLHVHVEDIADRVHRHLPPGEGNVDFEAIWTALEEIGYEGVASVELYDHAIDPRDAARRAFAALEGDRRCSS